ncbi:MAG: glycosyltransferase [Burkholderiaceae bacterium]|nr:glycosyltransferase [Burkholderiaceae bacterium]
MLVELWSVGRDPLLAALLVSLAVAGLLVLSRKWHLHYTDDLEHYLPQKIHTGAVPRVGGVAIALGVIAGGLVALSGMGDLVIGARALGLLLGAVPVLLIGLAEDIFKRLRPRYRLLAVAIGAGIAIQYAGIALLRTAVPPIDVMFTFYGVALGFTVFALVGAANAFNIIDGLNGLLAGLTLITMAGIAVVASHFGDFKVGMLAAIVAAATLGFLPFNWPRAAARPAATRPGAVREGRQLGSSPNAVSSAP